MDNANGCHAGLGSECCLRLGTLAARLIVIGQDHNMAPCKKLGSVLGQILSAAKCERGPIAPAERIAILFSLWPINPIGGQLGVERINSAEIWNAYIVVRFFCLPSGLAVIDHA